MRGFTIAADRGQRDALALQQALRQLRIGQRDERVELGFELGLLFAGPRHHDPAGSHI